MHNPIFNIYYSIRKRDKTSNTGAIFCIFKQGENEKQVYTNIQCNVYDWHTKPYPHIKQNANNLQECMDFLKFQQTIEKVKNELGKSCTPENLAIEVKKRIFLEISNITFLDLLNLYEQHFTFLHSQDKRTKGTFKRVKTMLVKFKDFVKWKYPNQNILIQDIKNSFGEHFIYWSENIKNASKHSFRRWVIGLKSVFNYAVQNDYLLKNPLAYIKAPQAPRKIKDWLTADELEKIKKCTNYTPELEKIKDLFLFQCYTAPAYCDLVQIIKGNVKLEKTPKLKIKEWIIGTRTKTDNGHFNIPILPQAKEIIEKYKGIENLPILPLHTYNTMLKVIAKITGIEKTLTTHMARRTFAMLALNDWGLRIETISKILGHTNIQTTQKYYACVSLEGIDKDFKF